MADYLPPYHLLLGYCVADALFPHHRIDLITSIFQCTVSFYPACLSLLQAYSLRGFSLLLICVFVWYLSSAPH